MRPGLPTALVVATLALGAGCNDYDTFRLTGFQQEAFSNKADILFVIDNSPSMEEEGTALATNFASFIEVFAGDEPPSGPQDLSDDVGRFLEFLDDRAGNVNYRIGITTTEAWTDVGMLLGRDPVLTPNDQNVPRKFNQNLLCEAACITGQSPVQVQCPSGVSPGAQNCADNEFGAREEPIEAVFLAMCGAVEDPPDACFAPWWGQTSPLRWLDQPPDDDPDADPVDYFDEDDVLVNDGWLRDNSVVLPVIISDEGDQSRRAIFNNPDPAPYPALFREFNRRMSWAVIGPNLDCAGPDVVNGTARFRNMVERTNGLFVEIAESNGSTCDTVDFAEALTDIGRLLRGVADTFPLQSQPVEGTIVVEVNGEPVPESEGTVDEELGFVVFTDGWTYDAASNSVLLKGDAVPQEDADVRIWYLPASGVPRELPF